MGTVDLHTHTTASDGGHSPRELVRMALERGLRAIAVTDHDSTEGVAEAVAAAEGTDLLVIPGVEISTDVPLGEVHLLGYYLEPRSLQLQTTLTTLREARRQRAQRMVEKLAALGMPLFWDRVAAIANGGAVGRPHVARALIEAGYVGSLEDAFSLYIGREGPAYVDRYKLTPAEAIALVATLGGLPVLAHPHYIKDLPSVLPELVRAGLVGIEVYYTGYAPDMVASLRDLAVRHDLVATGGSDFHGAGVAAAARLGEPEVPFAAVEALRARRSPVERDA